ncbi:MAG TPA: DUF305 domain-containing protein [Rhodothermales bacterium]|nr:DUF305 domain-containing protein [Rhodothermales bacterium]
MLLLFTTTACSSTAHLESEPQPPPETNANTTTNLEEIYWARQDSARMLFTKADVDFMTGMIAHHAQALIMSRMAPTHGASPQVQTLASRIINAQNDEIQSMQKWLRDREQPVPEVHIDGLNLMIHGAGDHAMHHNMPGMLSPEQMQELNEARGAAFDRLFLTYMIQHHSGAITMVDALFGTDGAGQDEAAFKLASDINVDQLTEIERMKLMLSELPGASQEP